MSLVIEVLILAKLSADTLLALIPVFKKCCGSCETAESYDDLPYGPRIAPANPHADSAGRYTAGLSGLQLQQSAGALKVAAERTPGNAMIISVATAVLGVACFLCRGALSNQ
jgi:hypothetical protein